jgi:hypothetical protein
MKYTQRDLDLAARDVSILEHFIAYQKWLDSQAPRQPDESRAMEQLFRELEAILEADRRHQREISEQLSHPEHLSSDEAAWLRDLRSYSPEITTDS